VCWWVCRGLFGDVCVVVLLLFVWWSVCGVCVYVGVCAWLCVCVLVGL